MAKIGTVCDMRQAAPSRIGNVLRMADDTKILGVELDGPDGLIITSSDWATGAYVVEELLELRPCREALAEPMETA
jgi:hypothetical protein